MAPDLNSEQVRPRLLRLLAEVLERDPAELVDMGDETPLFGGPLGLDSLTGMRLLAGIEQELGVDVAADDLALECLETIGTLTEHVASTLAARV
jgi:acyl carrier protein